MACFLVSAAEAVVVHTIEKSVEKKEFELKASTNHVEADEMTIPLSRKLKWLKSLLIGGAVLLAFEHIWHGEVVPWSPFLTAMSNSADAAAMVHEMATVGVCMALLITSVWFVMCKIADRIVRRVETGQNVA